MAKFMILYHSTMSVRDQMASATPEQMKAAMDAWRQWGDRASKRFKLDFGRPLQAVGRVTSDGVTASDSRVAGYSIMEGDSKDALIDLLKSHPHFQSSGASIDVLEMLPMADAPA